MIIVIVVCAIAVFAVLIGLQQFVTHQAQIALEEYETKQKTNSVASSDITPSKPILKENVKPKLDCSGSSECFSGKVDKIIDGDTIQINEKTIRFALASAAELETSNGIKAREHIEDICPVGSIALVDEDDEQTQKSHGRIVAKITCNGIILNEDILESDLGTISTTFCSTSEFSKESWAQKYGCSAKTMESKSLISKDNMESVSSQCDPSYPDVCIPPYPPDLDCDEISYKNFRVVGADSHGFDRDENGIGCEK